MSSMAKASASDALVHTADREMIQFHGGIGFTWEHDAHLYFRRAKITEAGSSWAARRCIAKSWQASSLASADQAWFLDGATAIS